MRKGYIQIYTGNGKGKSTAAFGLALRALGAGFKVFIGQFAKKTPCSELKALKKLAQNQVIKQYGRGCFIRGKPNEEDFVAAGKGFNELKKIISSGEYDIVILDEITIVNRCKLIEVDDVLELLKTKPEHVELVLTGRYADPRLIEAADLVTEMKEIKHYYSKNIKARKGIEK
jgi:cob(I)alamin adenosyltransferase